EHREHARADDVRDARRRLWREVLEEGRLLHVGRLRIPLVELSRRRRHRLPEAVALEDLPVFLGEELPLEHPAGYLIDLFGAWPDVLEEHRLAILVVADRLILEIDVHRPGE